MESRADSSSFNTFLLYGVLGVSSFIGATSIYTAISQAELKGSMMRRDEIEAKILEVRTSVNHQEADIINLRIDMTRLQNGR